MSDSNHAPAAAHGDAGHGHDAHPDSYYVRIWGMLLVMLIISVAGPEIAHRVFPEGNVQLAIVLFTAFGIAVVKAYMVVKNFMHIGVEKKYVGYLLVTMLALMFLMVGGVGPDVLRHDGTRWSNVAAHKATEDGLKAGSGHHGDAHGEPAHGEAPAHGEGH